jgi:hypothetical protein
MSGDKDVKRNEDERPRRIKSFSSSVNEPELSAIGLPPIHTLSGGDTRKTPRLFSLDSVPVNL